VWAFLIALAAAGALVGLAATGPGRQRARELARLIRLKKSMERGALSLEMAEDGAVLARRTGQSELEGKFKREIASIKKQGKK
jgi:HAMP domain-containing protein